MLAFSGAAHLSAEQLDGTYIGPRKEMISPWSTNAVEITQNMGIAGIRRIEEYFATKAETPHYDPMLQRIYKGLNQQLFTISKQPEPILAIDDIDAYNKQEGLALSADEVEYLNILSKN